ncbi:MAG TPA: DUF1453 domain-containing protein [Verrucomicrobiae bacterium]|jgi:hypothetical protein
MPGANPNYFPLIVVALVGWRVYRRIQRTVGRQLVRRSRMIFGIVLYAVLCAVFAFLNIPHPMVLAGMGAGLVVGVVVGFVGLHFTTFEATPNGKYYKSHPYIGISIAALLVIRMAYRMVGFANATPQAPPNPAAMTSPLTFAIFGLLAGYYITFYAGVLIRSDKIVMPVQGKGD